MTRARSLVEPHEGALVVGDVQSGTFAALGLGVSLRDVPGDRWVWSVTFQGRFLAACPSASPSSEVGGTSAPCPSATLTRDTVVIDYVDGHLLVSSLSP